MQWAYNECGPPRIAVAPQGEEQPQQQLLPSDAGQLDGKLFSLSLPLKRALLHATASSTTGKPTAHLLAEGSVGSIGTRLVALLLALCPQLSIHLILHAVPS